MEKLTIIKVGGKVVENEKSLQLLLNDFIKIKGKKILVHGGGKTATEISAKLGIATKMVEGRRITDAETLNVVTMVYAGLVNKNVVAKLQALQCNALGICGADLDIIRAVKRPAKPIDYGFVGDIVEVNSKQFITLLNNDIMPVIAPLTHDCNGQLLNTNADTMAQAIAIALSKEYDVDLIYCFEKKGVLSNADDENLVIPLIDKKIFEDYKVKKIITEGMIPKLDNGFNALTQGVKKVIITNAQMLGHANSGTILTL